MIQKQPVNKTKKKKKALLLSYTPITGRNNRSPLS